MITPVLLALFAAAGGGESLSVGVFPVGGNAPAPLRARTTEAMVSALRGIMSLEVIAMSDIAGLLGPGAQEVLERCQDDACRVELVKPLATQRLVIAELFQAPGGLSLEVRLVDVGARGAVLVSVSRQMTDEGEVAGASTKAAADLFRDRVGVGTLILDVSPSGAAIVIDGTTTATAPAPPLKVSAGPHTVRATAKGHRPGETVKMSVPAWL